MSKVATIASLVRTAARTEADFIATTQAVIDERDLERVAEYFDRLNIPRSVGSESLSDPLPGFTLNAEQVGTFEEEQAISQGIQKFLDRHERKIKWHAVHPSPEGIENVLLLMRCSMATTQLRLERLQLLLRRKEEMSPVEWSIARELMNRAYLSFRNYLHLLAGTWIDAILGAMSRDDLSARVGHFHEVIDHHVSKLEEHRARIEEQRQRITVLPEGFPPVRPPGYFGGDLLGRGPWKQYWEGLTSRAPHFRESLG